MSLDRSDTTDPYADETTERPTVEEGSEPSISPVQATQIGPQDAHWLRMDPSLARAVLAKTEEDLLGGLAALMRNKVEHEQVSRRLAQVQIDTAQAKHQLMRLSNRFAVLKRKLRHESMNRVASPRKSRASVRSLQPFARNIDTKLEVVSDLKNDAAQAQQFAPRLINAWAA